MVSAARFGSVVARVIREWRELGEVRGEKGSTRGSRKGSGSREREMVLFPRAACRTWSKPITLLTASGGPRVGIGAVRPIPAFKSNKMSWLGAF